MKRQLSMAIGSIVTLGGALVAAALNTAPAAAQPEYTAAPSQPVLIELFTSQGCSSCPPADKLASRLADEENVVVVSRPVTYWDRLGWKDSLARNENTRLQRAYARRGLAGRNGVYTPQIVVDGVRGTVGSNEGQVRKFMRQAAAANAAIAVRPQANGSIIVGIDGSTHQTAEVVLLALDSHESVKIGRGENGGRTISYTNILRDETVLGAWRGGQQALSIPAERLAVAKADRYALVIRETGAGRVLATRML